MRPTRPRLSLLLSLLLVPAWTSPATAQQPGVNLDQLIELATVRASKLRAELEEKLKPHLEILRRAYKQHWLDIDNHIDAIEKLGDSIVPLLLENLEPKNASPKNLNLAANSARALERMHPADFLDALIVIAEGKSYAGVGHAIRLLGQTASPQAGAVLTKLLDRKESHRMATIQALATLGYKGAAVKVAKLLPLPGQTNDELAVDYLAKSAVPAVIPEVFRALSKVKRGSQIMRYIGILRACAVRDANSAHRLLEYYDNQKLDRAELAKLSDTLAVVAPIGDPETIKQLKSMLAGGETGGLQLRTALALQELGDKSGPAMLRLSLLKKTRGSKHKKFFYNHANLGEFYFEFGDYKKAVESFRTAISTATGNAMRSTLHIKIARSQAHRQKWSKVSDALRDSSMPYKSLMQAVAEYPELKEALKHPPVAKFIAAYGQ